MVFYRLFLSAVLLVVASIFFGFAQSHDATATAESPILMSDNNPRLKTLISMRSQDANLSEILKILADRSGMNFVTSEGINKEKLTIILNSTPLDEAIDLVVRAAGLSYEIVGNSVLIAVKENLKGEVGQQGYVIGLKYADATEVAEMLSNITTNIKIDKGGNKLIAYTSPRVINEIERIVKTIDQPNALVVLDTRLVEVSVDNLSKYGITWGDLASPRVGIDLPNYSGGKLSGQLALNPVDFGIGVDLLLQNGDAKLLMNTKLTTTNNRTASIQIGEVIPYVIQTYNLSGSGGINYQIQKENTGIMLSVTPHVNEANQVTLTLEPEVSNIVGWQGKDQDIPEVRVRKASTTIRVENGQTIFLAGLLSEETSTELRKLPILGQIPLLGVLFQNRQVTTKKSNLIIEITPRIVTNSSELQVDKIPMQFPQEPKTNKK